jgi:hypothetical protein
MCGISFFVHVVEYIIAIARTFIVVAKTTTLSSIDECNQNWMTLFKIILVVSCSCIYNKKLLQPFAYATTTSCNYVDM